MTRLLSVVLGTLLLCGCGVAYKRPAIEGRHWSGTYLYSDAGEMVAVVNPAVPGMSSQACIFESQFLERCHYFETTQQAYDYLAARYAKELR